MRNKRYILPFLFILFSSLPATGASLKSVASDASTSSSPPPQFKATFFNVGQGNCTLVALPVAADRTHYMLADCGTSTTKQDHRTQNISRRVSQQLKVFGAPDGAPLDIVVSHADKDHYNLIEEIIADPKPFKIGKIILGGDSCDWQKTSLSRDPRVCYIDTNKAGIAIPNCPAPSRAAAKIAADSIEPYGRDIAMYTSPEDGDKNERSLVLHIHYAGKSILLSGDVGGKGAKYTRLPADVLQLSHHGSHDDCNTPVWLRAINPSVVVMSTGWQHSHPQGDVIDTCQGLPRTSIATNPHPLTFFRSHNRDAPTIDLTEEVLNSEIRRTIRSTQPIYSTADVQDIIVSWGADPTINVEYTNRLVGRSPYASPPDSKDTIVLGSGAPPQPAAKQSAAAASPSRLPSRGLVAQSLSTRGRPSPASDDDSDDPSSPSSSPLPTARLSVDPHSAFFTPVLTSSRMDTSPTVNRTLRKAQSVRLRAPSSLPVARRASISDDEVGDPIGTDKSTEEPRPRKRKQDVVVPTPPPSADSDPKE